MEPFEERALRLLLIIAAVCALVVLMMGARVHQLGAPWRADARASRVVDARLWGVPLVPLNVAVRYRALSSTPWYAGLVAAVVATAWLLRDVVMVVVGLLGPTIALMLAEMVGKPLVARSEFGGYGFPSGHTTASAALAATAALLVYRRLGFGVLMLTTPVLAVLPMGMVLAVVRVHSHLVSDAVAGVLLGFGTVLGIGAVVSSAMGRLRPAKPTP